MLSERAWAASCSGTNLSGPHRGLSDPNFQKWQLDLLPEGLGNQVYWLALDNEPGVFTYNLNTAWFPPGRYELRLRVVRNDSNYDEYVTRLKFDR